VSTLTDIKVMDGSDGWMYPLATTYARAPCVGDDTADFPTTAQFQSIGVISWAPAMNALLFTDVACGRVYFGRQGEKGDVAGRQRLRWSGAERRGNSLSPHDAAVWCAALRADGQRVRDARAARHRSGLYDRRTNMDSHR
jgi:hypothetical protein